MRFIESVPGRSAAETSCEGGAGSWLEKLEEKIVLKLDASYGKSLKSLLNLSQFVENLCVVLLRPFCLQYLFSANSVSLKYFNSLLQKQIEEENVTPAPSIRSV
jgi:hypothetical protein